jgi:hypothetical protein
MAGIGRVHLAQRLAPIWLAGQALHARPSVSRDTGPQQIEHAGRFADPHALHE